MGKLLIVSACLVGVNCKYDGGNNDNNKVKEFLKDKKYDIVGIDEVQFFSSEIMFSWFLFSTNIIFF